MLRFTIFILGMILCWDQALATFALTKYQAYGVLISSPVRKRAVQRVVLTYTAVNTDTDLDIGDDSGTFWTAAKADATYGAMATNALSHIQKIVANADSLSLVGGLDAYAKEGADYTYHVYTSAASSGGGASETMTVTGLAATDTVLSVTQSTKGANNTAVTGWSGLALNAIDIDWTADPGAGAKVDVLVRRTATGYTSTYSQAIQNKRPNITFVSGGAPTSAIIILEWDLSNEKPALFADYGI